jgi:replicative DNA helicase
MYKIKPKKTPLYARYNKAREEKLQGKINYIPFYESLPRFSEAFPGLIPKSSTVIAASKGTGKTKLTKFLSIFVPFFFKKNNPTLDFNFTVIWNRLEESEEEFKDGLMVLYLEQVHKKRVTLNDLNGYSKRPLDKEIIKLTLKGEEWVQEIMSHVILIDEPTPGGFYRACLRELYKKGTVYVKGIEYPIQNDNWKEIPKNFTYVPNDPNHIVVPVFDHLGLMRPEQGLTWYESAEKLSAYYIRRRLSLIFQTSPILVQQREAASQTTAYNYKGGQILHKIEPKITDLGKIKVTADDALTVIMLFNPARYEVDDYRGYDINKLGHNQRILFVRKNRRGKEGLILPLEFDGLTGMFKELPKANSPEMQAVYNKY